jgi:uncharacterized membrane protein
MNDARMQAALARIAAGGVLLAAAVILAGLVWYLAAHWGAAPGDRQFTGEPYYFTNFVAMLRHALDHGAVAERRSVIMIGIVLLLLNPLVRVALAAVGFFSQGDRFYAAISLVVFGVLLVSFMG